MRPSPGFFFGFAKLLKGTISYVMSVCLSASLFIRPSVLFLMNNSSFMDRIFMKFDMRGFFFQNLLRKFKCDSNLTRITKNPVLLRQYLPHLFLELETFQERCTENQNTGAIYEIIRKNMIEWVRPQTTIWSMRFEFWINKVTDTHSDYVILIVHFL